MTDVLHIAGAAPLLFVTNATSTKQRGGREMLGELHERVLEEILGRESFMAYRLPPPSGHAPLIKALHGLRGHIDGVDLASLHEIDRLVVRRGVRSVYLNGSNLGEVASYVKRRHPRVHVFTFCHNVEARFFWGAFRSRPTPSAAAVAVVNFLAERRAARHSDTLICINARDAALMGRAYGRAGDAVLHMALKDDAGRASGAPAVPATGPFALFVGGSFYANRLGVEWFATEVSPHLGIPTYVIGRGFESLRQTLEANANVRLIGEVESLAEWYAAAHVVVAPIFDGSGMKTKVAEALMHGRLVVGTPEAFAGYDDVPDDLRLTCGSAQDFIDAIGRIDTARGLAEAPRLRALYEQHYSPDAARRELGAILQRASGI